MSATEDDILFRIGFESHPQAGSKLEALAQAVEMTQKRIDAMFTTTGDRVAKAVTAMSSVMGKGPGGSDSGEAKMRAELKATADSFEQQTNRLIALQTDMVTKLDQIRAKDVSSADGHAKRLEAIYANTLANLNAAVAGAKAGTNRVQVAVGGSIGSPNIPQSGQGGASQLEAMATARKSTQARIVANAGEFNTAMDMAAGHEVLTLEERNEAAQLYARARAAIMRGETEMARRELERERELSQQGIEQLRKDIALIEDIQRGGNGGGATPQQATEAAERVKAYYDTVKAGQEKQAAEERKLADQQIRESKRVQDELDAANRRRRMVISNSRKLEESEARKAEADAKKADVERDAAIRRRTTLIANSRKYERQLAVETADAAIDAYEQETRAAQRATQDIQRGRQSMYTAFEQTTEGIGKLTRAAVLLGLAEGAEMEKVIRQLAMVQAGIDLVGGTVKTVRGAAAAFEGLRLVIAGKIAAQRAGVAADALAVQGSVAVQNALNLEALSASRTAAAHMMLARARAGGAPIANPIVPQVGGTTVAGSPLAPGVAQSGSGGRLLAMGAGAVLGGFGGAMAGGAIGERLGDDQGRGIGTVIGTVAGGIMGPMLAAAIAGRVGSGLSGGVGGILGRAGGVVMGGAGSVASGLGIGVGGGAAAVGGAALAALGGVALTLKSAVEVFRDSRQNGFMGGSQAGSFNDRVGGSNYNPASWIFAWSEKMDAAASAEKTKRMENASVLLRQEQQHLRNLDAMRMSSEIKRQSITRESNEAIFRGRFDLLRTPEEKLGKIDSRSAEMTSQRDMAARRFVQAQEREEATRFEVERRMAGNGPNDGQDPAAIMSAAQAATQQAMEAYDAAVNRVISTEEERLQITRQIAAENRKATLDQVKGIEDVIRARMKESNEIEKMMMSARARFGQMSEWEQERAKQAFQRVKTQGANADRDDVDLIRNIGTDETNRLVEQFDQIQGRKAGFDQSFGGEAERRQRAIEQSNQVDAKELGRISGQDPAKILGNATKPIQVNLVDEKKLNVVLNTQEDRVFNALMDKIEGLIKQREDDQLKRIADDERISQVTSQEGVRRAVIAEQ